MTIEESLPKDLIVKVITNNLNYVATQLQKFYQIMDHGCKGNAGKKRHNTTLHGHLYNGCITKYIIIAYETHFLL